MAASQQTCVDMTLTKLQCEVSAGRYVFAQPLTVTACGVQNKYVFYNVCPKCPKRVVKRVCPVHGYQRERDYRFALRLLLRDSVGSEYCCTCFDEKAVKILGFTAKDYVKKETAEERYESMSTLRGSRVMVVIKKRVSKEYVNYTLEEIDIVDVGGFDS